MATNPQQLKQIEKLLKSIQSQYDILGDANPFANTDLKNIKDADTEIKKLETGLKGVQSEVEKMNSSFGDLTGTLKAIVNEIDGNAYKGVKELKKGMGGLVKEANKLRYEEEGINTLNKKQLENILERTRKSQFIAKEAAKELLAGKEGAVYNEKSKRWTDERGKFIKALNEEEITALGIYKDQGGFQDQLIEGIKERIQLEDDFNKKLGFGVKAAGGLDKALQKAGLPALGIADAIEDTRQKFIAASKESKDGAKNFKCG